MASQTRLLNIKTIMQLFLVLVFLPLLPMLISGVWDWWEAWVYVFLTFFGFIISRGLASRRHPDIMEERIRSFGLKDAKPFDRILSPAMAFGSFLILIVAGLDKLIGWTMAIFHHRQDHGFDLDDAWIFVRYLGIDRK